MAQRKGELSKRERFIKKAKETIAEAFKSRDMVLSGVTKAIEEIQKVINVLTERFETWYEIYFPELKLDDRKKYVEVAITIDRASVETERIAKFVGRKKAEEIKELAKKSLGAELSERDKKELFALGERILSLYQLLNEYEEYQNELAREVAPNISELAGPEIAAKLIAHVGSLKKLAIMPAGTIQVLGAEKALFKHLKNKKIAPPKHGIIFQHPKISNSPKDVRGKIARALANKIALAAKADAFTKNFIAPKLKVDFEKRYAEILQDREKGGK
ncbi:MAG: hypothetical protein QW171_00595 [Candidatus Bilamarchaeaceae archaeon]